MGVLVLRWDHVLRDNGQYGLGPTKNEAGSDEGGGGGRRGRGGIGGATVTTAVWEIVTGCKMA